MPPHQTPVHFPRRTDETYPSFSSENWQTCIDDINALSRCGWQRWAGAEVQNRTWNQQACVPVGRSLVDTSHRCHSQHHEWIHDRSVRLCMVSQSNISLLFPLSYKLMACVLLHRSGISGMIHTNAGHQLEEEVWQHHEIPLFLLELLICFVWKQTKKTCMFLHTQLCMYTPTHTCTYHKRHRFSTRRHAEPGSAVSLALIFSPAKKSSTRWVRPSWLLVEK